MLHCWLKVLKSDKKAIFTAASDTSHAVKYLHQFQPKTEGNVES